MDVKQTLMDLSLRMRDLALTHKRSTAGVAALFVMFVFWSYGHTKEVRASYSVQREGEFKDGKILGSPQSTVVEGKEYLLQKQTLQLQESQKHIQESLESLTKKVNDLSEKLPGAVPSEKKEEATITPQNNGANSSPPSDVQVSSGDPSLQPRRVEGGSDTRSSYGKVAPVMMRPTRGPSIVSFPVKEEEIEQKKPGIVLPPGSYVKGKVLTGVEAPEGKTYPVLVQLDFAYIMPNHNRLDLSGCFMIAKATGNLSIERVEMQVSKLSCVSRDGAMFEREVNGFIADDKDNSFAVLGSVNSKQDRVAAMAFLASVVEGVSKAVQQAQTTQQTNALGGSQSLLTGDQMKYIGAGGAAEAANTVASWYLHQAQNLLPTINVGSGRDVWVIMQDSVSLPENYFKKGDDAHAVYTHFTRMLN